MSPTATKAKTKAVAAPAQPAFTGAVAQLCTDLRQINSELSSVFLERRDIIEILTLALLSRSHVFMLGPPGTAKTSLAKAFTARINNARFFRALMDKGLPDTALLGDYDIEAYEKGAGWGRDFKGTIADAHVAILDEAGKAGPSSLNPLLTMLEEREHKPYKTWLKADLITAIGASNELLEDEGLAAIWDRFMLRCEVGYIQEPGNFATLLRSRVRPAAGTSVAVPTFTQVDLSDLLDVIDNVIPYIELPDVIVDACSQLKATLFAQGITPSDRRWANAVPILQASAFLNGRSVVDDDDLLVLRYVLWDTPIQKDEVRKQVMALGSPVTRVAIELTEDLDKLAADIAAHHGQSRRDKAQYGGQAQYEAGQIKDALDAAYADAAKTKRNTTPLDGVKSQLDGVLQSILSDLLGIN